MKRWLLAAACGVVALGLLLYPLVGELLSEKYHSDVETSYTAAIEDTDDAELTAQREAAEQYNAMLANATISEGGASCQESHSLQIVQSHGLHIEPNPAWGHCPGDSTF